jgi:hypothetical protein
MESFTHSLNADGLVGQCEMKDCFIHGLETVLEESKQNLTSGKRKLEDAETRSQMLAYNLLESAQTLQKTTSKLQEMRRSSKRQRIHFDPSYQYDGDRAVELTQLTSRHLKDKPGNIGNNETYNCVKKCYDTLGRNCGSSTNYETDIRMLLNVCLASTWFTDNQMKKFPSMAEWSMELKRKPH